MADPSSSVVAADAVPDFTDGVPLLFDVGEEEDASPCTDHEESE